MTIKRTLKTRRLSGEPYATNLVGWLNSDPQEWGKSTRKSQRRMMDLLSTLRAAHSITAAHQGKDLINHPPLKLLRLLGHLNRLLSEYAKVPHAYIELDNTIEIAEAFAGNDGVAEAMIAFDLVEISKLRMLDRLKVCICGKHFFAHFSHQRSCSTACRRKIYEQTDDFKSGRRKYMRAYYRLKQSGKVK